MRKVLYAVSCCLALVGCQDNYTLLQTDTPPEAKHITDASIEYKILPQDRLKVVLYRDPGEIGSTEGASGKLGENIDPDGILVNSKGYIKLPLIGKVKVAGLTQTEASDRIEALYRKQLTNPSVYVEIMNKRIVVLGEVNKQGVVKLDKEKMTLFEALGFAGGLKDTAVRDHVVIMSYDPKKGMTIRTVDLTRFNRLSYASLMLRPNDVVYVQPNDWKKFRVDSDNYTSPFSTITKIASPFVTLKYLSDN